MLKPSLVKELKNILGPANLFTSHEELVVYSYDATQKESLPWAVARPAAAQEVSDILVLANRERGPVVPRGAGTGMSGGSVPVHGGIVLSLERMNKILEIDGDDLLAVVEPGVVTGDFQREVEARGLLYPPDPASSQFCTMGPPQRPAGASQETRPTSPPPTAPRASQASPAAPKPKTAKAAQPRPGEFWVYETVIDKTFTDDSQEPARPWHKTTIYAKDAAGERLRASTFDTTVGAKAEDFCQSREPVNLKLAPSERDARYTDLLDVEPVHPSEPEPEPESNTLPLDGPEDDIPF